MRTLALTQNITLDGAVEMITDWFSPSPDSPTHDDEALAENNRLAESCDTVLLGRRTFEDFRGYWPLQTDDETGITAYLDQVQKYVVSGSLKDPEWQNSTVLSGDVVDEVTALKAREGTQDIVVTGSITLSHTLIEAGLVDEYRLSVYPSVQGRGRRLFPDGLEIPRLRLIDAKAFGNGVVLQRYAPA
ncbi:hypothetical protein DSC45_23255 [Streptomyces sp. YIM 130001]|uniref:dihydrofolate reductase family protein n=1 Tax=Streptomyces sp. YIM 130001 TaxID=2259644 RepID=UPI000E64DE0C|nr:dihydrofolate reductase family protein [Streptomyces sp. YIM 130001]RII13877.1 hypothetical protein DSC45_23255 [Streptomyces sp. YIM 130001]